MVLPVRVVQPVVHLIESRAIEGQGLRSGEWHTRNCAPWRAVSDGAAGRLQDQSWWNRWFIPAYCGFIGFFEAPLGQQDITVFEAAMQRAGERLGHAVLGHALRGQRFERTAHIDGIGYFHGRECAHHVAARFVFDQQPFLREHRQSLAHRRARDA